MGQSVPIELVTLSIRNGLFGIWKRNLAISSTRYNRPYKDWHGRGRHTTTSRSLHHLPSGALLLDTPEVSGELKPWQVWTLPFTEAWSTQLGRGNGAEKKERAWNSAISVSEV